MQRALCTAILTGLLLGAGRVSGQTFLNGSFENNTSTACNYNLANSAFNSLVSNVYGIGGSIAFGAELDLQTGGCYVQPQAGSWCVGLDSDVGSNDPDAIALELSAPLTPGTTYQLAFYAYANPFFQPGIIDVHVGVSPDSSGFGTLLWSSATVANTWRQVQFTFTATQPSRYITVRSQLGVEGWVQVDNFSLAPLTGQPEEAGRPPALAVYPNPATGPTVLIKVPDAWAEATFELVNATGQRVRQGVLPLVPSGLDVADLPQGIYNLTVRAGQRAARTRFVRL